MKHIKTFRNATTILLQNNINTAVDVFDVKHCLNEDLSAPKGTIRSNESYADIADL